MPRIQANSVLYPVVRPVYQKVEDPRGRHYRYSETPVHWEVAEWEVLGWAYTVDDAKKQGFKAPILDMNFIIEFTSDGDPLFINNSH